MSKQVKDFSPEERQLILKDAEELGLHGVADKYGTTWQAVCSIRRMAEGKIGMRTTTPEEREEIWKRAGEVGFAQAAAEYNLKEDTIKGWQWKYNMEKHDAKSPSEKKMPKIFTPEERAEIVEQARQFGMNHAMKKYDVSKTAIRNWMKKMQATTPTQQSQEPQPPQQPSLQEPSTPIQLPIQESPIQPHYEESVNTVAPINPDAITENRDKPALAIEALPTDDPQVKALAARVQELSTEVAVLKERNAVLTHKLEIFKKAMEQLLS